MPPDPGLERLQDRVDVFVVGGGPAGLAVAIAARRRGLSVVVADGAIPPIDKPCGEGLMPDGLEALRELGVEIPADDVYPFRGIRFVSGARKTEAVFPRGVAYGIRRTALHRILIDHAAACGVSMLWQSASHGTSSEMACWSVEGSCLRDGLWGPMGPVPAFAIGRALTATGRKSCASDFAGITASPPGPITWNCIGEIARIMPARSMSLLSAAKKSVWR